MILTLHLLLFTIDPKSWWLPVSNAADGRDVYIPAAAVDVGAEQQQQGTDEGQALAEDEEEDQGDVVVGKAPAPQGDQNQDTQDQVEGTLTSDVFSRTDKTD